MLISHTAVIDIKCFIVHYLSNLPMLIYNFTEQLLNKSIKLERNGQNCNYLQALCLGQSLCKTIGILMADWTEESGKVFRTFVRHKINFHILQMSLNFTSDLRLAYLQAIWQLPSVIRINLSSISHIRTSYSKIGSKIIFKTIYFYNFSWTSLLVA